MDGREERGGWEREIRRKESARYQICTLLKGSGRKEGGRRET